MNRIGKKAFAPMNCWYVAFWSDEVSQMPVERWIMGKPLVFYRDSQGKAIALDARCPHRGYPLALGRVEGDTIQCGYHGMRFGGDGRCTDIPCQEKIPSTMRVKSYLTYEAWKWIWIWMGEADICAATPPPDHDILGLTTGKWESDVMEYSYVEARHQLLHDNLLDLTHLSFLHETTLGSTGLAMTAQEIVFEPGYTVCSRYISDTETTTALREAWGISGRVDRELRSTFFLPHLHWTSDRFVRHVPTGEQAQELAARMQYHAVTPATEKQTHYFFVRVSQNISEKPRLKIAIDYRRVLDQDVLAIERIEQFIASAGPMQEVSVKTDEYALRVRKLLEKQIVEEEAAAESRAQIHHHHIK